MSILESKVYVGVDVASKHLDLFFPDTGKSERIKNDTEAVKALRNLHRCLNRLQPKHKATRSVSTRPWCRGERPQFKLPLGNRSYPTPFLRYDDGKTCSL